MSKKSELPTIQIKSTDIKEVITALINDYIRIEKTETGLDYQQKNSFKMGQINIIASFIEERWNFRETGQNYHDFLKYLTWKYELNGVSEINVLESN